MHRFDCLLVARTHPTNEAMGGVCRCHDVECGKANPIAWKAGHTRPKLKIKWDANQQLSAVAFLSAGWHIQIALNVIKRKRKTNYNLPRERNTICSGDRLDRAAALRWHCYAWDVPFRRRQSLIVAIIYSFGIAANQRAICKNTATAVIHESIPSFRAAKRAPPPNRAHTHMSLAAQRNFNRRQYVDSRHRQNPQINPF